MLNLYQNAPQYLKVPDRYKWLSACSITILAGCTDVVRGNKLENIPSIPFQDQFGPRGYITKCSVTDGD